MSFDMNIPKNLSNIQASHKSCDGGGGNTGYFRRDGGSEEEEILNFAKNNQNDCFVKEKVEENNSLAFLDYMVSLFKRLKRKIKKAFYRAFKKKK